MQLFTIEAILSPKTFLTWCKVPMSVSTAYEKLEMQTKDEPSALCCGVFCHIKFSGVTGTSY